MAEAVVRDWQSNKSLAETNKYMWINKVDCDVTFLVGAEKEKVITTENLLKYFLKKLVLLYNPHLLFSPRI